MKPLWASIAAIGTLGVLAACAFVIVRWPYIGGPLVLCGLFLVLYLSFRDHNS